MNKMLKENKEDIIILSILILLFGIVTFNYKLIEHKENTIKVIIESKNEWILVSDSVEATIYNAIPSQCKADISTTASNFILDLKNPEKHRIIAIERTMMNKYGLSMGDVVKIEGTDKYIHYL